MAAPAALTDALVLDADVLVLGGGPAGCSAAIAAAEAGARVILADKGHCGTSGAAASAGVGVWYVDDTPEARGKAMASREELGGRLASRDWMERVLSKTRQQVDRLAEWGHPFPVRANGEQARMTLQGPELMRRMRREVVRARVKILDHAPALELLQAADGGVAGAAGVLRQKDRRWRVDAPAVVIATGGCGFLAGGMGCNVLTGDGHLMAAELGAELSGMEFSNAYAISPTFSSVTKTAIYSRARFLHADGRELEGAGSQKGRSVIAKQLLKGDEVHAILDGWAADEQQALRNSQPNFFLSFDRFGIDPFTQAFPVTLRLEGTIRGTGGLRVVDEACSTSVSGLFAAGDAATRELICGGFTGGGSHNSAWALSSGAWSGAGAAAFALTDDAATRTRSAASAEGAGRAGLRPVHGPSPTLSAAAVTRAVQDEVHPYDRNLFRTGDGLAASQGRLDDLWEQVRAGLVGADEPTAALRAREAAAMTAHARWMYAAASARGETRGMHRRIDAPERDPGQQQRRLVGGLDELWTANDPVLPIHSTDPLPAQAFAA